MKKLLVALMLLVSTTTFSQDPDKANLDSSIRINSITTIDTTKSRELTANHKQKRKKIISSSWDKVSLGIFVVVTAFFFSNKL